MSSAPLTTSELRSSDYELLLVVSWAGQEIRLATSELEIWSSEKAQYLLFKGALNEDLFEEEIELFSDKPSSREVSLEVPLFVDVPRWVEAGHDLATATAELSAWVPGRDYEGRIPLVTGRVQEPEYGATEERVSFSLEQNAGDDRALVPGPVVVDRQSWPSPPDQSIGKQVPFVFGQPGRVVWEDGTEQLIPATPAVLAEYIYSGLASNALVIAQHWCQAGNVVVHNKDDGTSDTRTIDNIRDDLGNPVCVVYLDAQNSGGAMALVKSASYWISWSTAAGMIDPETGTAIRGAGDLLRYMMQRSTLSVDMGRLNAIVDPLNRFKLGGFINKPVRPSEWVRKTLTPLLPIAWSQGQDGIYPWMWDLGGDKETALDLVFPRDGYRTSRVSYERENVCTALRVEYGFNGAEDSPGLTVEVSGAPDATHRWHHLRVGYQRYGRQEDELETRVIYDVPTAMRVGAVYTRRRSFVPRTVEYSLRHHLSTLRAGDRVTITDPELYWRMRQSFLKKAAWGRSGLRCTFWVVEDVARDEKGSDSWGVL